MDDFFSNFDCGKTFPYEGFQVRKNMGGTELISGKKNKKLLYAELNEKVEAATSSYSATGDFL